MRNSSERPSATSLPASPQDDSHARSTRYLLMMGVRILCIILMVVITPYSWYTWVLGIGAVFLPYIAVVLANVGSDVSSTTSESPERPLPELTAAPSVRPATDVILIHETPPADRPPREGDDA